MQDLRVVLEIHIHPRQRDHVPVQRGISLRSLRRLRQPADRDVPDDEELSRHYPSNYYSINVEGGGRKGLRRALKAYLTAARDRADFGRSPRRRTPAHRDEARDRPWCGLSARRACARTRAILDVGSGSGELLDRLARLGFRRLSGCDPFLAADGVTGEGVPLRKCSLDEMNGPFDVILFNQSFEHLPDPQAALRTARAKLSPNGLCIIRIPTPDSDAFAQYGTNWAQWDAPRHLTLMSRKGFSILAGHCGFTLGAITDVGYAWSLMLSELYAKGDHIGPGEGYSDHFSPTGDGVVPAQVDGGQRSRTRRHHRRASSTTQ